MSSSHANEDFSAWHPRQKHLVGTDTQRKNVKSIVGYIWALPVTSVGLVLALLAALSGGAVCCRGGVDCVLLMDDSDIQDKEAEAKLRAGLPFVELNIVDQKGFELLVERFFAAD